MAIVYNAQDLRMLNSLEENDYVDTLQVLNTPYENEDIILACDKLIVSLEEATKNATKVLEILTEMKAKYLNPPL